MMKKILITASALLTVTTVAYGAQILECDYDRDTGNVIISGTSDISVGNEVTVNVNENGTTVYEGQTTANNGKYSFSFKLTGDAQKTYNVKVGEMGVYTAAIDSFIYYGRRPEDMLSLLKTYADANNLSDFKTSLTEAVPVLGIKLSEAETEQLNNIADIVMTSVKGEANLTVQKLKKFVGDALFVQMIRVCNDASELDLIFKENSEKITGKYPLIWSKYAADEDAQRLKICAKIINHVSSSQSLTEESAVEIFMVETAAYYINNATGWENAKNFISDAKSEIGITASALSADSRVYVNMMNKTYNLKDDFNKAYTAAVQEITDSGSGSGSGSGKTSGSGGGVAIGGGGSNNLPSLPQTGVQDQMFNDLGDVEWAKTAIEALAKDGIIKGKGDGKYSPMDSILREESAAMIVRLLNLSVPENKTGFNDIVSGAWYEDYCYAAKDFGIVNGIGDNTFGIGTNITRQDFVTIIYRAMQRYDISGEPDENIEVFSDTESIAEYARESANYMKKCGIIQGKENELFCPTDNITRAEAAKILYFVRNLKIESDYVKSGGAK